MVTFEYLKPRSLDEAISLMESYGEEAIYVAGATDVMVKIRERKIAPKYLISLRHVDGLDTIRMDEEGVLYIGSGVTHRRLELSEMIQRTYPIIHDAVRNIGSVQVRNVATIGGNVVNAVPSADGAVPLLTLDAVAEVKGPKGGRRIPLRDFFIGPGMTLLEHGEIVTEFEVPARPARTGSCYIKHTRREAMELPLLGVAAILSLRGENRRCEKVRLGLGVAAPTPIRAFGAESVLEGAELVEENILKAADTAAMEARVRDSVRGEAWYRREMVGVLVARAIRMCAARAEERA
ncbi:MAG: xanthine dehydrogenase family protein subunit M [Deltaproteobacteria bacterium]|nr:xanthine dehydrogenase family protein subunit M [Deltaproteobacteria bacterium]